MNAHSIQIRNRLEDAVQRFSDDTALWIKDKTGQQADAHQCVWIKEIEENPRVLIYEPPRGGKTWSMEAVDIRDICCNAYERALIVGPVQKQAKNALREHLDWVEGSEILKRMIARRRGKPQISDTRYELINRSSAEAFGLGSNIDSEDATILRGEEWDDMDLETWNTRILQRGGRKNKSGLPLRIRLSGTIQFGNGPVYQYQNNGKYYVCTLFNIYHLMAMGIYDELAVEEARDQVSYDEWLRIYMLKFTEAKNFIWETSLQRCLNESKRINWQGVPYDETRRYKPQGVVYVGIDCGHSGEGKVHSVYRADFIEVIGQRALWLNGVEWESTEDPEKIENELVDWIIYYGAEDGYGDALKSEMMKRINEKLFDRGHIEINCNENPENKPSNWLKWSFAPQWNTGKAKYLWAGVTRSYVDHARLYIPYFDPKDDRDIAKMAKRARQCLLNIRERVGDGSYPILEIIDKKIGDDAFDSINMAMGCASDRMIMPVDFSKVGFAGGRTVTAGLITSAAGQLREVGRGSNYGDFGIN